MIEKYYLYKKLKDWRFEDPLKCKENIYVLFWLQLQSFVCLFLCMYIVHSTLWKNIFQFVFRFSCPVGNPVSNKINILSKFKKMLNTFFLYLISKKI